MSLSCIFSHGRGYENTAELHFDATYPYGWNPQRDKRFFFSEPLHTETLSWYSHKENGAGLYAVSGTG